MKWTDTVCVDAHDTDFSETARPAALLRYMQSAANMQLHTLGPSNEALWAKGQAFVLSKIGIVFYEPVKAYDVIKASTWSCDSRGYSFNRCYSITKDDTLIAEATSVWALIDSLSHKPLRVEEFQPNFLPDPIITPDVPLRFSVPKELEEVGVHTVTYGETDTNRHMNNVRYLDMLCDFINMEELYVEKVSIQFLSEAPTHKKIRIFKHECGDEHFFSSVREDGRINVQAYIKTRKR